MKFLWSKRRKIIAWSLSFIAILLILFVVSMTLIINYVNRNHAEIQALLDEALGLPVTFETVKTHWVGASLAIALNEVVVYDSKKPIPFVSLDTLELRSSLLNILLKRSLDFDSIAVQGLKLVLGRSKNNVITLLGLKGETLPEGFHYDALIKGLSGKKIKIKNGELQWLSSGTPLIQYVMGTLESDLKTNIITFQGKQRLSLRMSPGKSRQIFLRSKLDFTFNPENKQAQISMVLSKLFRTQSEAALVCKVDEKQTVDCKLSAKNIDLQLIHQNIKLENGDIEWLRWLIGALEKGKINQAQVKVTGPSDHLDYQGELFFQDIDFQYAAGWPKIQNAMGKINLLNEKLEVQLDQGHIKGAAIQKAKAIVAPLFSADPSIPITVDIKSKITGRLEQGLQFLQQSPLKKTAGKKLALLTPKGPMNLDLDLNIPIHTSAKKASSVGKVQVMGRLQTENAQLTISELDLPVNHLKGDFLFTEDSLSAKHIDADMLGRPFEGSVSKEKVTVTGVIPIQYLQNQFATPWLQYFSGQSQFTVSHYNEDAHWQVESALQGTQIDLPSPLGKSMTEQRPMSLIIYAPEQAEERFALLVKDHFNAKWVLPAKKQSQRFIRAHVVFGGTADWTTQPGLKISGHIPQLKVNEWGEFIKSQPKSEDNIPFNVHLLSENLDFYGLQFKNTWLDLNSNKKSQLTLDGSNVKGTVYLPVANKKDIAFDFEHLKINAQPDKHSEANQLLSKNTKMPVRFSCRNLYYNERRFGNVSFQLSPRPYGYEIQNLNIKTNAYTMDASGKWQWGGDLETLTRLVGNIYSEDMGQTFAEWGFTSAIKNAPGRIQFELEWPKTPFEFSLAALQGVARVRLKSGRITGVNVGFGKILGLLSLENIHRFGSLLKEGFVFDSLEGNLNFQRGLASTSQINVEGPVASVVLSGQTDLKSKELDFKLVVTPKMTGGLPLAAGFLGGPVVGMGAWVVGKLVGSKMGSFTKYYYQVSGTWDAPSIVGASP